MSGVTSVYVDSIKKKIKELNDVPIDIMDEVKNELENQEAPHGGIKESASQNNEQMEDDVEKERITEQTKSKEYFQEKKNRLLQSIRFDASSEEELSEEESSEEDSKEE